MNPQRSAPRSSYPDPTTVDQAMASATYYRSTQPRQLQPALSQDEHTLANSIAQEMNGHAEPAPVLGAQRDSISGQRDSISGQRDSISGQRDSIISVPNQGTEPNADLSFEGKPKVRSKVSRACDECRKTKVRCDAATSTSAGSVNDRCSNCARKNVSCQFNRPPQKRGPSKGYIKELADRVFQIEANAGLPGARPSFDAGDSSPPEGYSPTQSLSGNRKRNHSQIEGIFPRHSLGGFTLGNSSSRPRDSIALAPDERFEKADDIDERVEMRQPFWMSWSTSHAVADVEVIGEWSNTELFEAYLALVDPHLSVLPSYDTFKGYVSSCPPQQVAALEYVMSQSTGRKVSAFTERELEDYVVENAKQNPKSRTPFQNVVWLWIYAFMILNADADLERLIGVGRPILKSSLIELAAATDVEDPEAARVRACLGVLSRLHALGTGTRDESEVQKVEGLSETALLSCLSNIWSVLAEGSTPRTFRLALFAKYDAVTKDSVQAVVSRYDIPLAAQAHAFVSLMLSRQNRGNDPEVIRAELEKLVETLAVDTSTGPLAKPMEAHLYIVAVLTCLELIENDESYLVDGRQTLNRLRPSLQAIQQRVTTHIQTSAAGRWSDIRLYHWVDVLTDKMDRALVEFGARPASQRAVSSQVFAGVSGQPPTVATNSVVSRGTRYVCYNFGQMSHQGWLNILGLGIVPKRLKLSR